MNKQSGNLQLYNQTKNLIEKEIQKTKTKTNSLHLKVWVIKQKISMQNLR